MLRLSRMCMAVTITCIVGFCVFSYLTVNTRTRNQQHVVCVPTVTVQLSSKQQRQKYNVVVVQSTGNFKDRVTAFNTFLSFARLQELKKQNTAWQGPTSGKVNLTFRVRGDYLPKLSKHKQVSTIVLPWINFTLACRSVQDTSNMLISTYYQGSANKQLCSIIERSEERRAKRDYFEVTSKKCCKINDTLRPLSEPYFYKKENTSYYLLNKNNLCPTHVYTVTTFPFVFFVHILRNAFITSWGTVVVESFQLALFGCIRKTMTSIPSNLKAFPLYDEAFVISQYWGGEVFHRMVEVVPRLSLYVQFLKANTKIRIMAPDRSNRLAQLLEIIGLQKSRLVSGMVRAKIVYLPRATPCGGPNVQESQMMSQIYRDYVKRTFPPQPRNKMVLIRRTKGRGFKQHKEIEKLMMHAAVNYNLTYTLFRDNPVPSLNDTMVMFHSAAIIVAPHGAGLSNMLFSQPGTYIIEGVCNPPTLCFYRLARVLGHHWHGVMGKGSCYSRFLNISTFDIFAALNAYLRMRSLHR